MLFAFTLHLLRWLKPVAVVYCYVTAVLGEGCREEGAETAVGEIESAKYYQTSLTWCGRNDNQV